MQILPDKKAFMSYREAAVVALAVGQEMLARLDWITLKPRVILELGLSPGWFVPNLKTRFPEAEVITWDPQAWAVAPRDAGSIDLIFANHFLPWQSDIEQCLSTFRALLRPDGLLSFSALGPDTLRDWRPWLGERLQPQLLDMHDWGDGLMRMGFADPVLDVDYYTVSDKQQSHFFEELSASGFISASTVKAAMDENLVSQAAGNFEAIYEIIYVHAFAPAKSAAYQAEAGVVQVPVTDLRRQLRARIAHEPTAKQSAD